MNQIIFRKVVLISGTGIAGALHEWFTFHVNLYICKNVRPLRVWGAESPSRLPGNENYESEFGAALANLALKE